MTTLNLMESLPDIAGRIGRAGSIFLGLDFDGTLAPICPRPDDVVLSDHVRETLSLLAQVSQVTVMIVSGRGLADVSRRVGLPELIYAGNHGLEIRGPRLAFVEPTAAALADRLRGLTSRLEKLLREVPGALVEPKGLTTSVHDRNVAPEFQNRVEQTVREVVAMPRIASFSLAGTRSGRFGLASPGTRARPSIGSSGTSGVRRIDSLSTSETTERTRTPSPAYLRG